MCHFGCKIVETIAVFLAHLARIDAVDPLAELVAANAPGQMHAADPRVMGYSSQRSSAVVIALELGNLAAHIQIAKVSTDRRHYDIHAVGTLDHRYKER